MSLTSLESGCRFVQAIYTKLYKWHGSFSRQYLCPYLPLCARLDNAHGICRKPALCGPVRYGAKLLRCYSLAMKRYDCADGLRRGSGRAINRRRRPKRPSSCLSAQCSRGGRVWRQKTYKIPSIQPSSWQPSGLNEPLSVASRLPVQAHRPDGRTGVDHGLQSLKHAYWSCSQLHRFEKLISVRLHQSSRYGDRRWKTHSIPVGFPLKLLASMIIFPAVFRETRLIC